MPAQCRTAWRHAVTRCALVRPAALQGAFTFAVIDGGERLKPPQGELTVLTINMAASKGAPSARARAG